MIYYSIYLTVNKGITSICLMVEAIAQTWCSSFICSLMGFDL